jgi:Beta-propeller repeat
MSPSGQQILHLTIIGASFAGISLSGIAIDSKGDILLAGGTNSPDFPTTPGTFQPASPTGGAFLLELDPTRLIYCTYLDQGLSVSYTGTAASALAIDGDGNAYIAGTTSGATFSTTIGALHTVTTSMAIPASSANSIRLAS